MHIARLPGFTAEASIYTSPESYAALFAGAQVGSGAVTPAQFDCPGFDADCGDCIPTGPSIFSPGRQFCTIRSCQPTIQGGCRCRVIFKGFLRCQLPLPDVATAGF